MVPLPLWKKTPIVIYCPIKTIRNYEKNIFLLTTTLCLSCSAQLAPHPAGSYTTNSFLDKFAGTWIWTSGTDTMQIVLQKQRAHFPLPMDYDKDMLVGWHSYVKNGVLVESSLQYVNTPFDSGHITLFGSSVGKFRVRFTWFKDLSKNKHSNECYLNYTGGTPVQATWSLRNSEGVRLGSYDHSFSVPTSLTFTKL